MACSKAGTVEEAVVGAGELPPQEAGGLAGEMMEQTSTESQRSNEHLMRWEI